MAENSLKPVATPAAEGGAPMGEQTARAQGQHFTALLREGLLPLIEQIASQADTLASPGRRGGAAPDAAHIQPLSPDALVGRGALARTPARLPRRAPRAAGNL